MPGNMQRRLFFSCNTLRTSEIDQGNGERFEAFMDDVSNGNPMIRQQVLELIGVIISVYMPKNFFLLVGPGDSGKSQILSFIKALVGDDFVHSLPTPNSLSDRWTFGALAGKRLCYCPDTACISLTQATVAAIKQMTGGDLLQGEIKNRPLFTFVNEATLVFVSNYPLYGSHDDALLNRLVTIPFLTPIPKERQIPNFSALISREKGYIVGQAIRALDALRRRNFDFTRTETPALAEDQPCVNPGSMVARFVGQY